MPFVKIAFLKTIPRSRRTLPHSNFASLPRYSKISGVRSHSVKAESREARSNGFRTSTGLSFIPSNPKLLRP
jgi:hypothetical protein